eukprot:CAMPEP_0174834478 /NCGR_PEP_ID=MMETSP1114-20130205/4848_1 /TAXON_ID=312471 /ORGANISM="Neobodo designis, Strain CCAP 1951/1" /LENGTH=124 /DNA_ID=CAMNT_0016068389 /DNA_START=29 /DNA_END=403 /DNA_ORIENTATION=+
MPSTVFRIAVVASLMVALLAAPAYAEAPQQGKGRKWICGSDTDCVVLQTANKGALKLDQLDFKKDTAAAFLEKLPSWFGPRPAEFVHKGSRLLNEHETLEEQGVAVGDIVKMYKAGKWHEDGDL